jgi:tetratricopeptide (TPR) repeat protein
VSRSAPSPAFRRNAARVTRPWLRVLAPTLLLLFLTVAALGPVLDNGFVSLDDPAYVSNNPRVLDGITADGLLWALTARDAANWHPLTWFSHMLDTELFGVSPRGRHGVSLAMHAATTALFFLFLLKATGSVGRSLLAAAFFGVHPLRVESVAWVAERKDVLAALFWMSTLLAYLHYARRPAPRRFLAVFLLLCCGLAAKATLLSLPAVLLVLDVWPLGRLRPGVARPGGGWRLPLAEKGLLAVPALAAAALTLLAQRDAGMITDRAGMARLGSAAANHLEYFALTIRPARLYIPRLLPDGGAPGWAVAGGLSLLVAVTAAAWVARRRAPSALAGWFWYLIAFTPMIGLVQLVNQSVADRYTYLPSAGLAVCVVWGAAAVAARRPLLRAAAAALAVALAGLLVSASRGQAGFWKDDATLFGHAAALDPANPMVVLNLGTALLNAGAPAPAERVLRQLLAGNPAFTPGRIRLAQVLLERRRPADAVQVLMPAISLEPLNVELRVICGLALGRSGRTGEALGQLETALRLRPADPAGLAALRELWQLRGQAAPPP